MTKYDLSASSTGKTISCHEEFCSSAIYNSHGPDSACLVGSQCGYGRMLAAIDFQLGGNGLPTDTALYYTKLSIGTPPKDYYVQMS